MNCILFDGVSVVILLVMVNAVLDVLDIVLLVSVLVVKASKLCKIKYLVRNEINKTIDGLKVLMNLLISITRQNS